MNLDLTVIATSVALAADPRVRAYWSGVSCLFRSLDKGVGSLRFTVNLRY